MVDFHTVLIASGFVVDRVVPDGKWHRVKTVDKPKHRNGAYLLRIDGRTGYFKNWATDQDFNTWKADGEVTQSAQRKNDALALAARTRNAKYQADQIKGMRAYWRGLAPMRGGHPYLTAKGLDMRGCNGLRVDGDLMVIPIMRDGLVMSLQTIAPDGEKRFMTGCPVKGGVYLLDRKSAVLTCFAEGFSTGLAVYQSIEQSRVIVCFDAGNLVEVAKHYHGRGLGVVCADNDWVTEQKIKTNPGLVAATKAAEAMGCGVAYPEDIEGTDWADVIAEFGVDARRFIKRKIIAKAAPFCRVGAA